MTNQVGKIVNPENEEELALLKLVATGDRSALTRLYLLYHARLFKFVFRLTRSYATADEIVNDTMLVIWDKAASFRGDSKVSTWIFGIAYKQTMRRVTRKQLQLTPLTELDDGGHDHNAVMEIEDWVRQGLHTLPAAQQLTVVLVFYLGLTVPGNRGSHRLPGQYGQDTDVSCAAKIKEIFICISNAEKIDSRDQR